MNEKGRFAMNRAVLIGCFLLTVVGCTHTPETPQNVILFIGDGLGVAQRSLAEEYSRNLGKGSLAMNTLQYHGITRTCSASSLVTDSAAAGTAIACGVKTNNGWLGLDAAGQPVDSCAQKAVLADYKAGLLSTAPITHATPAAFYANHTNRNETAEIEAQLNYGWCFDVAKGDIPIAEQNPRALAEETARAITELAKPTLQNGKPSKGFFLMVEGGQIDWACHANDPKKMLQETLALDAAIKVALAFQEVSPNTLIIVTGDHETGGLSLGRYETGYAIYPEKITELNEKGEAPNIKDLTRAAGLNWGTSAHTGSFVITSAQGPQAEKFTGFTENTDIGNILKSFY